MQEVWSFLPFHHNEVFGIDDKEVSGILLNEMYGRLGLLWGDLCFMVLLKGIDKHRDVAEYDTCTLTPHLWNYQPIPF